MAPMTGAASVRAIRATVADAVLVATAADPEQFKEASTTLAASTNNGSPSSRA
jgi:hypothetical protein